MMTGPLLLAVAWTTTTFRPTFASFIGSSSRIATTTTTTTTTTTNKAFRLFASADSSSIASPCVSRLATLQTLLSKHGAPGSQGCNEPNDLEPVTAVQDTPELLSSLGSNDHDDLSNIHPYLYPIAKSTSTGNYICAYRNPSTEESDKNHPWPIVETKIGAVGFQLLSLNSEHMMRRIVCECDFTNTNSDLIQLYNEGLGKGLLLKETALDQPYELGSVEKLGYGVDKYVLLRVGPFPDLYQTMSREHFKRGDEQSSLIAAEAANTKLTGFGSTFRFYARLLSAFPNREEETRDAARMCLRLPLPTIGMDVSDLEEVALLGQLADESATPQEAIQKIKEMYMLIKQVEEEDPQSSGKTKVQEVIEQADDIINQSVLDGKQWSSIRPKLGGLFRSIKRDEIASFIDF